MDTEPVVVVGADGTETSLHAVEWAAREAQLRGAALRIVHIVPAAARVDGGHHGRDLLARAYTVAHRSTPDVRARTELLAGDPVGGLVAASVGAALLVVGIIGERIGQVVLGSLAPAIAVEARCPVTVVRGPAHPSTAPVVVGVEEVAADATAILTAFSDAHRHGSGVVVIHARRLPADERNAAAADLLAALAPWRERYPEIDVDVHVVPGPAADELLRAAFTARLVVVASRGRGTTVSVLLGSTSRAVLRHSRCPVTVVRRDLDLTAPAPQGAIGEGDPHDRSQLW